MGSDVPAQLCGSLLSPEMLQSCSNSSPSCAVPGSHPGGFFWPQPVLILHLARFGELPFPNGLGILHPGRAQVSFSDWIFSAFPVEAALDFQASLKEETDLCFKN